MKPEDQIVAIAELDGWKLSDVRDRFGNLFWTKWENGKEMWRRVGDVPKSHEPLPPYLTSRDAIVPVIEKQSDEVIGNICNRISGAFNTGFTQWKNLILSTPAQLAEALLRATGKWKS